MMKTLGEIIAELRRERGITQESLAGIIGVSSQAISKWENNVTTTPSLRGRGKKG